jgi:ABC-type multidrug transport system fused ATPase/permease subunit
VPPVSLQNTSVLFLGLSIVVSIATLFMARTHLACVTKLLSRQPISLTKKLGRLPEPDRLSELRRHATPQSIEWRIADEALQVDETFRPLAVDSVLADVALELEARSSWPRAAVRIAGASGVLLMALAISMRLELFVAAIVLVIGIFSALACMTMERRAVAISKEVRRSLDALVDVLGLHGPQNVRGRRNSTRRPERRKRHRRTVP